MLPFSATIFVHFDGLEKCRGLIKNQQHSLCVCNHRPPRSSTALPPSSPSALPPIYARSICCAALFCCLAFFRHFSFFFSVSFSSSFVTCLSLVNAPPASGPLCVCVCLGHRLCMGFSILPTTTHPSRCARQRQCPYSFTCLNGQHRHSSRYLPRSLSHSVQFLFRFF